MHNGDWSYLRDKFISLLIELKCYEADYYVPSHHKIYDRENFYKYVDYMKRLSEIVLDKLSIEEAKKEFFKQTKREPNKKEIYDMNCFVCGNQKELQ